MVTLAKLVLKFLWVTVWGKINIWQFLTLNKHYLILAGSNVILSLLFIYMVEQTTVRTDQYRKIKEDLVVSKEEMDSLNKEILVLKRENKTLVTSFSLTKPDVDTNVILDDYQKWASEVKKLENDIKNASKRLEEIKNEP